MKEKDMATAKMSKKTATKKTATKKATVKTAAKKAVAKKTAVKKTVKKPAGMKKGSKYTCGVCGLAVTVDTACGCGEAAHIICCEKPMKMKK